MKKSIVIMTVLIGALALMIINGFSKTGDPGETQHSTMATPSAPTVSDLTEESTLLPISPQAKDVITNFVSAFYSQKYTDTPPTAWVSRAAQWATPEFGAQLNEQYPPSRGEDRLWREFVEKQSRTEATVEEIRPAPEEDGTIEAIVRFTVTVTSTEDVGVTPEVKKIALTQVDGRWAVKEFSRDITYTPKEK